MSLLVMSERESKELLVKMKKVHPDLELITHQEKNIKKEQV